ncbi:MAG: TIGR03915 family putative DNA repair protein [Clostridia bacterium]|nr:TIGR03915 family putative DNA repair protein [Clostridia bacterium]
MTVFITDKNEYGLYSALFYAFTHKIFPDNVITFDEPTAFTDENVKINVNKENAVRVKKAILKYGAEQSVNAVKVCLLSCEANALITAFDFCRKTLETRKNCIEDLSLRTTTDFLYTVKKVLHERHKFTGFLRFRESENGVLYAPYSPDNDITELITPHFVKRLNSPFIIHDVSRNVVSISDGQTFKIVKTTLKAEFTESSQERECEELFRTYFKSVNIKERKNIRQQNSFMPKKYRKYMTENTEIF